MAKHEHAEEVTEILSQDQTMVGGRAPTAAQAFSSGTQLANYLIEDVLGEGGGGTVYAAHHRATGQRVAIKVLRAEMLPFPALVTRFVREAEAVNKINHPNIVAVYEFGELERGRPYYVMELLEGMDLRKLLTLHGRFSPKEVLQLIEPVCSAVQAAHNAGFIHRDLKANNVLIVDGGDKRVVKLLDFGIAKMYQAEASGQGLTEPGMFLGTAHNMAPEQIRCEKLDTRADIYALGVLIYQLLTGHYPFEAEDPRQIVLLHLQAPPPRPSSRAPVPPAVDAVVLKCLEKKAERRFGSADDLIAALRAAVGEEPEDVGGESTPAVGIYVEIAQGEDEEMSDAIFEDVTQVLDMIEQDLAERHYVFPLRTATALLGVRPLVADKDVSEARSDAYELACELRSGLSQRPDPHPDVRISISVTVAEAQCRSAAAGIEVTGGPLLEVGAWSTEKYVLTA